MENANTHIAASYPDTLNSIQCCQSRHRPPTSCNMVPTLIVKPSKCVSSPTFSYSGNTSAWPQIPFRRPWLGYCSWFVWGRFRTCQTFRGKPASTVRTWLIEKYRQSIMECRFEVNAQILDETSELSCRGPLRGFMVQVARRMSPAS